MRLGSCERFRMLEFWKRLQGSFESSRILLRFVIVLFSHPKKRREEDQIRVRREKMGKVGTTSPPLSTCKLVQAIT